MSGKSLPHRRAIDPRARRTQARLGEAMIDLVREKPFEAITVQELLARAGVSRSTFYEHYRDKDDLFLSSSERLLDWLVAIIPSTARASDRVLPVRELFAHVAEMDEFVRGMLESGQLAAFQELAQGYFARAIEQRFAELPRAASLPAARRAPLAQALAGGLLTMMWWWLENGRPGSPEEMDALFHRQVWSGVGGA